MCADAGAAVKGRYHGDQGDAGLVLALQIRNDNQGVNALMAFSHSPQLAPRAEASD